MNHCLKYIIFAEVILFLAGLINVALAIFCFVDKDIAFCYEKSEWWYLLGALTCFLLMGGVWKYFRVSNYAYINFH